MRKTIGLVTVLCALLAWSDSVFAGLTYKVIGVAEDDRLNVRQDWPDTPGYKTVIGSFGPHDTGIESSGRTVEHKGQRWYEVEVGGATGWVNGKYLEIEGAGLKPDVWTRLKCGGTEPFWDIALGQRTATYSAMGEAKVEYNITRKPGVGVWNVQGFLLRGGQQGGTLRAIVTYRPWCSDGMSDYEYPFMINVWLDDGEGGVLTGCCSLGR